MTERTVYKNTQQGQPLISTISSGCKTPVLTVKFCNLVNPFRYPNSPTIPRYSVTCVVDTEIHKDFLTGLQTIERDEKVESVIKNETMKEDGEHFNTGNVLIKFQSKDQIKVYKSGKFPRGETPIIELEDELAKGERIVVVYDILRYTKKNTMKTEHGLSFKPTAIFLLDEGEDENGSN